MEEEIEVSWADMLTINMPDAIENLGDEEMAIEMLATFEDTSLIPNMGRLHKAIFEMDYPAIEFVSHTLKGTAGTMGCDRFTGISLKINRYLRGRGNAPQSETLMKYYSYLLPEYKSLTKKIHELQGKETDCSIPDQFIIEWEEFRQKQAEEQKGGDTKGQTKAGGGESLNKVGPVEEETLGGDTKAKSQNDAEKLPAEKKEKKVGFADQPAEFHQTEKKQNTQEGKCACCLVF